MARRRDRVVVLNPVGLIGQPVWIDGERHTVVGLESMHELPSDLRRTITTSLQVHDRSGAVAYLRTYRTGEMRLVHPHLDREEPVRHAVFRPEASQTTVRSRQWVRAIDEYGFSPETVGLGRLVELRVRSPAGESIRVKPTGARWLAWKPDSHDLVVLHPALPAVRGLPSEGFRKRHVRFHAAPPAAARIMDWPKPDGQTRPLGLVEAVIYDASGIDSPSKGRHQWIHHFGDRGSHHHHHGSAPADPGHFPERVMPHLDVDQSGNLFIVRRPGNRYRVGDWIRG
jgi:hypothetical protein